MTIKAILIHPAIALVVAIVGMGICKALGLNSHVKEMLQSGTLVLMAAEISMLPLYFVRGKTTAEFSQAGLISTVIHMLICAAGGLGIMQWEHPPQAFLYWLCAFYWAALAGVCVVLVRSIKAAPNPPGYSASSPNDLVSMNLVTERASEA